MKAVRGVLAVAALAWVGGTAVTMTQAAGQGSALAPRTPQSAAPAVGPVMTRVQSAPPVFTAAQLKSMIDRYCLACHNDRLKTGDITLENIDYTRIPANAERLEKVVRKLLVRAMPPAGVPRPSEETYHQLLSGLESELDRDAAAKPDPGPAVIRRLNRTEYSNAIRDLLDLDVDVSGLLPVDNSSDGFDNIAEVLGMSPALMEGYLAASRKISAVAVGDEAEIGIGLDTYRAKNDLTQGGHIEGLPLGTRGGMVVNHTFPLDAEYTLKVSLREATTGMIVGMEHPHELVVTLDGAEVASVSMGGKEDYEKAINGVDAMLVEMTKRLTFVQKVTAGPHTVGVAFVQKSAAMLNTVLEPVARTVLLPQDYTNFPIVRYVTIAGPTNVTGPGDTPSRRRIFVCRPKQEAEQSACATKILSTIARRAYRRPLTQQDVQTLMAFYEMGRARRGFEAGIGLGLRRILASPDFVLRVERAVPNVSPGTVYRVSDVQLASRLSFFLWSTIPDEELLRLASERRLSDPVVLRQQVRRMLQHPNARALIDNFAAQWMQLRNLASIVPDIRIFPDFDHELRTAMVREVELIFERMIREDRSVLELLTGDSTFLNERLARHYGIPNVYGDHFRPVTLESNERRGLFGKGAILLVTSLATRTSPVTRGKWILENIVGTPPPPPPPDVDTNLKDSDPGEKPLTLRQRMEAHRSNPTCAACHRMMDPIGFALEHFDAVGSWRETDEGAPVDASGRLMDGSTVDGAVALREALARNPEVFLRTMTEKLMIYALGRKLESSDMPTLRRITASAARGNYRFSSLVLGIVESVPFQRRIAEQPDGDASAVAARGQ